MNNIANSSNDRYTIYGLNNCTNFLSFNTNYLVESITIDNDGIAIKDDKVKDIISPYDSKVESISNKDFQSKYGIKLGFMSFFVKACVVALKTFPSVNAEIEGDEIIYKNYYNISFAVGTEKGLVVPVLRNADELSFADIEKNIKAISEKARDGKLSIEDLQGGTFTISNGGVYGSMLSTPILNLPQSGVLGMHNIVERPVAINVSGLIL